jgi:hypothetical protein
VDPGRGEDRPRTPLHDLSMDSDWKISAQGRTARASHRVAADHDQSLPTGKVVDGGIPRGKRPSFAGTPLQADPVLSVVAQMIRHWLEPKFRLVRIARICDADWISQIGNNRRIIVGDGIHIIQRGIAGFVEILL